MTVSHMDNEGWLDVFYTEDAWETNWKASLNLWKKHYSNIAWVYFDLRQSSLVVELINEYFTGIGIENYQLGYPHTVMV